MLDLTCTQKMDSRPESQLRSKVGQRYGKLHSWQHVAGTDDYRECGQ